jgi:diguanylate cyclase (GGDEF)-like protein
MGLAWPLQVAVVAAWIAAPHPPGSHPLALGLITLAALPLYLPLLVMRRPNLTRIGTNIAMVFGVGQMCAMVWAGGGLASGFELMPLWFVPLTVCLVPAADVIIEMLVVIAGAALGAVLANHPGLTFTETSMWGFSLMAIATLLITSGATGYVHSELQAVSERFRRRSVQDPLTGLANRAALSSFSSATVADGRPGTAYVIDIDGFKLINDSLGHHAGDVLLTLLADRLRSHARSGDLLARAGGDEFVLIARGVDDAPQALALGGRLFDVCAEPFALDGTEAHLSVTVGAALLGDAPTVEESLRDADLALYAAKSERRGTARLFEPAMHRQHAGEHPLALLDRLRATGVGLELDDFGTGYSSLSRLSRLRLSAVKVDRSFVHRMLSDATADAAVSAVVRMSEAMGIDVVAEGVERSEQVTRLAELGCRYGQGFLFARPLEADAVEPLLDSSSIQASLAA